MILRFSLTQDVNASVATANVKLIECKTGVTTFEKVYSITDKKRNPFGT